MSFGEHRANYVPACTRRVCFERKTVEIFFCAKNFFPLRRFLMTFSYLTLPDGNFWNSIRLSALRTESFLRLVWFLITTTMGPNSLTLGGGCFWHNSHYCFPNTTIYTTRFPMMCFVMFFSESQFYAPSLPSECPLSFDLFPHEIIIWWTLVASNECILISTPKFPKQSPSPLFFSHFKTFHHSHESTIYGGKFAFESKTPANANVFPHGYNKPDFEIAIFRDKSAAISHLMVCVYVRVNSHVCEIHYELVLTFTFVKSYYFSFEA